MLNIFMHSLCFALSFQNPRYTESKPHATTIPTTHKAVILSEAFHSGVEGAAFAFEFSFAMEQPT
jgi:hypothetical protein